MTNGPLRDEVLVGRTARHASVTRKPYPALIEGEAAMNASARG